MTANPHIKINGESDWRAHFWSKVSRKSEFDTGHWIWEGEFLDGLARYYFPRKQRRGPAGIAASHAAFFATMGVTVPLGLVLKRVCEEPRCINPDHRRMLSRKEAAGHPRPRKKLAIPDYTEPQEKKPVSRANPDRPWQEAFWDKVDKTAEGGCWTWLGSLSGKRKYPVYSFPARHVTGSRIISAASVAWFLVKNEPLDPHTVLKSTCFNYCCINPEHRRNTSRAESAKGSRIKNSIS